MDCADCARAIEAGVAKLDGVSACALNYAAGILKVQGAIPRETVIGRVRALGYGVQETRDDAPARLPFLNGLPATGAAGFLRFLLSRRTTALALLGALLILPGLLFNELLPMLDLRSVVFDVTSLGALLAAGLPIARSAWRALRINRRISINLLMTIAAIGAVAIGATTEAGLVMVLFAIGEALEGYTMERARDSIRSLMRVAPNEATALRPRMNCREHLGQNGYAGGPCPVCGPEETRVFVDELAIGETIVVKPGERVAMDGLILEGASSVNQAPITGESLPVDKTVGAEVFAGSINGEGALVVKVTHRAQDNTISRVIAMVEQAQDKKAPAERFVDQFAKYYTPAVVGVAVLVALVPPLIFGAPFLGPQGWLYRALELLVVACPCALVISTPVALISAISNAARNGVLVKGGASLEALSRVRTVALDKTGTLTEGQPRVVKAQALDCVNLVGNCDRCDDLLALASAVERRSEHPLAKAIVDAADARGVRNRYAAADTVTAITGRGVTGEVDGRAVLIGSHAYFDDVLPHETALCGEIDAASALGHTPMLVGENGRLRGYITLADTVRDSSREALARLAADGIATIMLTGDNAATASAIARDVGVSDVRAGLLPGQKADAIKALLSTHRWVAMVGDGVNDAPALATATVGIAMGAGSGQALETADVALMANDLRRVPYALRLARAAMGTIRGNIAFAIGIKLVFLALVLMGLGTLWMAVFADVGASLIVTLNGMRLLGWRDKPAT